MRRFSHQSGDLWTPYGFWIIMMKIRRRTSSPTQHLIFTNLLRFWWWTIQYAKQTVYVSVPFMPSPIRRYLLTLPVRVTVLHLAKSVTISLTMQTGHHLRSRNLPVATTTGRVTFVSFLTRYKVSLYYSLASATNHRLNIDASSYRCQNPPPFKIIYINSTPASTIGFIIRRS